MKQRTLASLAILGMACLGWAGCRKTIITTKGTSEQREFLLAFRDAHDKGNSEAEKALVDWDDVSDDYKAHFIRVEIEGHRKEFIKSIGFSALPPLPPQYWEQFNLKPDIFLAVQYDDPQAPGRSNLYPIGLKDGRYLIAMQVRQSSATDWP